MKNTHRYERGTQHRGKPAADTSWDSLAHWYDNWVGEEGSEHHRELAIPTLLALLEPQPGEKVLDVGAGQGVLAPYIAEARAYYTGIDASPRLVAIARQRHGKQGRFLVGDARELSRVKGLHAGEFDAVVFLQSIQDMDPLDRVIASAAWALKPGGRLVAVLKHPAFRVPRQSGWGWDAGRKLQYRRVDRYLTPLPVPMTRTEGGLVTRSFHRPVSDYVNALSAHGILLDRMLEVPAQRANSPPPASEKATEFARQEIPLLLALRARKMSD